MRLLRRVAGVFTLASVLVFLGPGCKSPTSPGGKGEADIIVTSHWADPVDIYMDGTLKFAITYGNSSEIDNVSLSNHLLEAKNIQTGVVVASKTIEVTEKTDYTWTIEHIARINVLNNFGETLKISMDDQYLFDLADNENRWILDVAPGDRLLKAVKASDGKQVASTTLRITENKDYSWTVEVITSAVI